MKKRDQLLRYLNQTFPDLDSAQVANLASENLISDHVIELPVEVLNQAQQMASACSKLRHNLKYQNHFINESKARGLKDPGNDSIAMSFDFHLNVDQNLKLIEVNTNAAFLALSECLYQATRIEKPVPTFDFSKLKACLEKEMQLSMGKSQPRKVAIVDESPQEQRLYVEFLIYQEIFRSWEWPTEICDSRSDLSGFDLIYNRDTDFFLEGTEKAALKKKWESREACLSPHPYQYLLLADKQRLIDWQALDFLQSCDVSNEDQQVIRNHLPWCQDLEITTAEDIWAKRKTAFLKPKRSFGAKQSYRGGSISRKMFDELIPQGLMAQEFIPAPEVQVQTADGLQKMKYDLRFYSYAGEIQSVIARIYQGQVTNLRTPGGGFACVRFV